MFDEQFQAVRSQYLRSLILCTLAVGTAVGAALVDDPPSKIEKNHPSWVQEIFDKESAGQIARRNEAISTALQTDPTSEIAHWMAGQLKVEGQWLNVSALSSEKASPLYLEYLRVREKAPHNAAGHLQLAHWCKENSLEEESQAHLAVALHLNPNDVEVQAELGKKRISGKWEMGNHRKTAQLEMKRQQVLAAQWKPIVLKARSELQKFAYEPGRFDARAAKMNNPSCVPVVERYFSLSSEALAHYALDVLEQFEQKSAILSLRDHAIYSQWQSIRSRAAEILRNRRSDFVTPMLIAQLDHLKASIGEPVAYQGTGILSKQVTDEFSSSPKLARALNERLASALNVVTQQSFGQDSLRWNQWWAKEQKLYFDMYDPTNYPEGEDYVPKKEIAVPRRILLSTTLSCFSGETLVWTRRGARPIKNILPGDIVIAMNVESGELAFKPVLRRTMRPPTTTKRIEIGDDKIDATAAHPVWVNGKGWSKVSSLKVGQTLRCLDTLRKIDGIAEGKQELMYNLIVADFATYFIGNSKVLVHDNGPIEDEAYQVPGMLHIASTK